MCESYWSAVAVAACAPLLVAVTSSSAGASDADGALAATLANPAALVFLVFFWLTAYVKDAGKFWLIKHASALRQKVVAIGFPFGTWACGLVAFYVLGGSTRDPAIGTRWSAPSSGVKLVGFVIIFAANVAFLLFKSGRTCGCACLAHRQSSEEQEGLGLASCQSWLPTGPSYRVKSVRLASASRNGAVSASGSASRWVERLDTF